jgi:hypothetical protein
MEVPTAAPTHTVGVKRRAPRVSLRSTRIIPIRIPAPLPHIPPHVKKPIPVRRKISHRTRIGSAARRKRRVIADRRTHIVGIASRRRGKSIVVRLTPRNRASVEQVLTIDTNPPPGCTRYGTSLVSAECGVMRSNVTAEIPRGGKGLLGPRSFEQPSGRVTLPAHGPPHQDVATDDT